MATYHILGTGGYAINIEAINLITPIRDGDSGNEFSIYISDFPGEITVKENILVDEYKKMADASGDPDADTWARNVRKCSYDILVLTRDTLVDGREPYRGWCCGKYGERFKNILLGERENKS